MLGLFLMYWIGKEFYKLSELHLKNKWIFAILGIASYYFGAILAGFLIGIIIELGYFNTHINDISDIQWAFIGLPFGLLTCWLFYRFLKKTWNESTNINASEFLDENIKNL